jgi:hypothetical protein
MVAQPSYVPREQRSRLALSRLVTGPSQIFPLRLARVTKVDFTCQHLPENVLGFLNIRFVPIPSREITDKCSEKPSEKIAVAILTPSQRRGLGKILETNDFAPDDFELRRDVRTTASDSGGEQLRFKGTDYYFSIFHNHSDWNHEKFWLEYSPGEDKLHDYALSWSWNTVCQDFAQYLFRLCQELAADDPWMQPGVKRITKKEHGQTLIPAGNQFTGQRLARAIFATATKSLDLMDPYMGPELLDRVDDAGVNGSLALRLLTGKRSKISISYYQAFKKRYSNATLRVLEEEKLHDRFVIVDGAAGYHFGHSIKDLGKKDTHVSPVEDIEPLRRLFEERWTEAKNP